MSDQDPQPDRGEPGQTIAAVDLGSNSFHMKVAQVTGERMHVIDRMRDGVRLAAGLDEKKRLSKDARSRAIECLRRFGQRLREVPAERVRAVGTNSLRRARNAEGFLGEAEEVLGHSIEIISGIEEARIVYLGVAHTVAQDDKQRLVVDIGGGSTEFIIGKGLEPVMTESLYMGCVSMSRRFFAGGKIDEKRMVRAETFARQELERLQEPYRRLGWDETIGSSGTIRNARDTIHEAGWSDRGIRVGDLRKLRSALLEAGHVDKLSLRGLQPERASVFPGGVAILLAVLEELGVKRMSISDGALREGLLWDLHGRSGHEDVREATVRDFCSRYRVDDRQADRVSTAAMDLYDKIASAWSLEKRRFDRLLGWAARLHEIGLAIAHGQYHKHGAYLLEHSDMPGFSRQEQKALATLVRVHRRRYAKDVLEILPERDRERMFLLSVVLRLAVVLRRGRSDDMTVPSLRARSGPWSLSLEFPAGWLEGHPLTQADLAEEAAYLESAGVELMFE